MCGGAWPHFYGAFNVASNYSSGLDCPIPLTQVDTFYLGLFQAPDLTFSKLESEVEEITRFLHTSISDLGTPQANRNMLLQYHDLMCM
jgi:hypothetical protein